jgi:hypothetical protein
MAKFGGKVEEIMERQTKHLMMPMKYTNPEAMKIEQDPGMMQSAEEHQEIPTEDAAVMAVGEPRKRRRVQKLATERRQKLKEGTGAYCGLRRRVTAVGKRTSRHATVAWRRRKLFRISGTLENCGSRKTVTVTCFLVT